MKTQLIHRLFSLCAAALFTLAIWGGIDQLAQQDADPAQWAQSTDTRA